MLALAIISTVILGLLVLIMFGAGVSGELEEGTVMIGITILAVVFVIIAIWILYAR